MEKPMKTRDFLLTFLLFAALVSCASLSSPEGEEKSKRDKNANEIYLEHARQGPP